MAIYAGEQERSRSFQGAVGYAVSHRIRVEILTILHEREDASASELARIVRQPLSTVTHHVEELQKAGSIEISRTEKVRSVKQNFYRVSPSLFLTEEEVAALSEEDRQEICRMVLQGTTAEAMDAFWGGKLVSDLRACMIWSWLNVDQQGRQEILEEQMRSWERLCRIEADSDARRAESGEKTLSVFVSLLGFERCRNAPGPPCASKE